MLGAHSGESPLRRRTAWVCSERIETFYLLAQALTTHDRGRFTSANWHRASSPIRRGGDGASPFDLRHTEVVKAVPIIAIIFAVAVILERGNAETDGRFWAIVAAGIVGVVAAMSALRSRGGIGATG